jgi:hypothetical protein
MSTAKEPKVKLTLSIRKSAIEQAKIIVASHGTSLSNLIEEYLINYTKPEREAGQKKLSLADQLFGCAKDGPLRYMTDKEIKDLMVKDKYGL